MSEGGATRAAGESIVKYELLTQCDTYNLLRCQVLRNLLDLQLQAFVQISAKSRQYDAFS